MFFQMPFQTPPNAKKKALRAEYKLIAIFVRWFPRKQLLQ